MSDSVYVRRHLVVSVWSWEQGANQGVRGGLSSWGGVLSGTFNKLPCKDSCHLCHHSGQINSLRLRKDLFLQQHFRKTLL